MGDLETASRAYLEALETGKYYEINACYSRLFKVYRDTHPEGDTLWRGQAKKYAKEILSEAPKS